MNERYGTFNDNYRNWIIVTMIVIVVFAEGLFDEVNKEECWSELYET